MNVSLVGRPLRKSQVRHENKFYGKRRHSFGGGSDWKHGSQFKKRSKGFIVPPTKFLLGGNISDPLNLGSLADEEINRSLNEVTPYSSPVPTLKQRAQVEVLIPPNINDPLNLNAGDDEDLELALISLHATGKRRKPRKRKKHPSLGSEVKERVAVNQKSEEVQETDHDKSVLATDSIAMQKVEAASSSGMKLHLHSHAKSKRALDDKIVSPVIPQPGMRKRSSTYSRSISRDVHSDVAEASVSASKPDMAAKSAGSRRNSSRKQSSCYGDASKPMYFRKKDERFQYGNYNRYYGYRNPHIVNDPRLKCLKKEWFEGKDVLDIGCNVGHITLTIARDYHPRKIVGVDIDRSLVEAARHNVRNYLKDDDCGTRDKEFPISLAICYGPIAVTHMIDQNVTYKFPNNVCFLGGNYVLKNDDLLESQKPEFDVILCLSLTKWVHLNWGDVGIKRMFKRIYCQLHPGGRLILEAQAWASYTKKKKCTETIYNNYQKIQLKPEQFTEYLLSKEVGFTTCEVVDTPYNASKGFRRPIQVFTKTPPSPARDSVTDCKSKHLNNSNESTTTA